jgi:predicted ATP-grasp superfamily ATP-dependent carboligase
VEDHDDKRLRELTERTLAAFMLLGHMLGQLPVPITLPELDDDWDPVAAVEAVELTRTELLKDEPIDSTSQRMLSRALLDWLTVYELRTLVEVAGPAPWRIDAMDYGLHRLVTYASEVADRLGIDSSPPDSE